MTKDVPHTILSRSKCDWSLSPVLGARSPGRRFVYRLGSRCGSISPFGSINRSILQRTAGLLRLAHIERQRDPTNAVEPPPSYGPAFTYTEFMLMSGAVGAFFTSLVTITVFLGITFVTPVRPCRPSRSEHYLLLNFGLTGPVAR